MNASARRSWARTATLLIAIVLLAVGCSNSPPTLADMAPNAPEPERSSAGLISALAGDNQTIYAIGLNSGIWKSSLVPPFSPLINKKTGRYSWEQLVNSPPGAISIAVDPNDSSHLVVGERNGDAVNIRLNRVGLWESFNAGVDWTYAFNPLAIPCTSQAVPAVAFSPKSTIFISTACGIGRRPKGATTFEFNAAVRSFAPASAILSAVTRSSAAPNVLNSLSTIWARTPEGALAFTKDDGGTWVIAPPRPANFAFSSRGDDQSLAGFSNIVFMTGCCSPNSPGGTALLSYQSDFGLWVISAITDVETGVRLGDGTGRGGRRFVRSFYTVRTDISLPADESNALFVSDGQGVIALGPVLSPLERGTSLAGHKVAATPVEGAQPTDPTYQGDIHSDLWDLLYDQGDPGGAPGRQPFQSEAVLWVAGDGGVFQDRLGQPLSPGRQPVSPPYAGWTPIEDGLHTLHVNSLNVMYSSGGTRIAIPTADNDGWVFDGTKWQSAGCCADGNWGDADAGNPSYALLARSPNYAKLQALDPSGTSKGPPLRLTTDAAPDALFLQFIQTLKNQQTGPLDAVMLVHGPVLDPQGKPVSGPLGRLTGPALIRNTHWDSFPDVAAGGDYQGWAVEATGLPQGTQAFWVSNGHKHPVYYLSSRESGSLVLYKGLSALGGALTWQRIFPTLLDRNPAAPCGPYYEWYGPAFINPYDPSRLVILANDGVKTSTDGGKSFIDDKVLTALITASGTFPLTRDYCPSVDLDGGSHSLPIATRELNLATLSHVAFSRDDPNVRVAVSPFTGVFVDNGYGIWRALGGVLPHPAAPVAAAVDQDSIFVAFGGRSVVRVDNAFNAPRASYFQVVPPSNRPQHPQLGGGQIVVANLLRDDGAPLASKAVEIQVIRANGTDVYSQNTSGTTNAAGEVEIGVVAARTGDVVSLHFSGDDSVGPSSVRFFF